VLHCVHALEKRQGCGTTQFCQTCGAEQAILKSRKDKEDVQECRITQTNGKALDLLVKAKTVAINSKEYTVFTAIDISHEKRRRAMERIFFHDLLNTASALNGFSELMGKQPERDERINKNMRRLSKRLLEEITEQRELASAESNELTIHSEPLSSLRLIREMAETYTSRWEGTKSRVETDASSRDTIFRSDPVLLERVLGNLIKNAVEASQKTDVVTIGTLTDDHAVSFWVHNPHVIPGKIQLQIFQRSFSTKGVGRGLGTYSAKLLTEHYLNGRISFTSRPEEGTTFTVAYPLEHA
jgi:signal transduction histidine kinase